MGENSDDRVGAEMRDVVGRAVEVMREQLGHQLTVDDLARSAMFSRFHFSRIFQRVTGVSPGRFLSALRLHEAKRLLLATSDSVTDISYQVGYHSVGTFSARFHSSVGLSPSAYRQAGGFTTMVSTEPRARRRPGSALVHGRLRSTEADETGVIFVGLFPEPVPQGQPVCGTIMAEPDHFLLTDVPSGTWYLVASSVRTAYAAGTEPEPFVAVTGPVTVHPCAVLSVDLPLRRRRAVDPPLVLGRLTVPAPTPCYGAAS
ncbi:AraC family transcriptional regulator [Kutzneria kofuensis]|uniref:AraC-like DNA-binding protein n=1 Tax=Kutzneria kofuensis TaxID=103725 RepID=A0A7W9KPE1_9PSEU|nr:AraC family transcriptional regulator [Kutzneria kofuensis]MBB5896294.1 AraC-like DNA-binding protein [Kutzneria kofuensis]